MLNWAGALHDDAVEVMEQAEKGKYGVDDAGDEIVDSKKLAGRLHAILISATSGEPRNIVKSTPRG